MRPIDVPPTFKSRGLVKSLCLMVAQDCKFRAASTAAMTAAATALIARVMSPEVGRAQWTSSSMDAVRVSTATTFLTGAADNGTVKEAREYVRKREQDAREFKLTLTTNGVLLIRILRGWNDNNISVVLFGWSAYMMPCVPMRQSVRMMFPDTSNFAKSLWMRVVVFDCASYLRGMAAARESGLG